MLPTLQETHLRDGLLDYLTTTFALADSDAQTSLGAFLSNPDNGIFKGPYLRLRRPFAATTQPGTGLEWTPAGFTPHGHQTAAWSRLASTDGRTPQPTLVSTGTGSGKTECFLVPILDHVARARRHGTRGLKALILYPMNALAHDQAGRLAATIASDPRLAGITAALYTGDTVEQRTMMSPDALITSRDVIRSSPPDILLTNYKMLDQLLLRGDDQKLWAASGDSLTYLVLDEFHTYDGAQGTDVAMLLRRLGWALAAHRTTSPTSTAPLGDVCPVATSATLGDGQPDAMTSFATTIFGTPFTTSCVITETRETLPHWLQRWRQPDAHATAARDTASLLAATQDLSLDSDPTHIIDTLLRTLWDPAPTPASHTERAGWFCHHPWVTTLLDAASAPQPVRALAATLFPDVSAADASTCLSWLAAGISALRHLLGRSMVTVDTHLWVRELTRIDRLASTHPSYRWSDDGAVIPSDPHDTAAATAWPALYCRHCGRSGWGVMLEPTGNRLATDQTDTRRHHLRRNPHFRALIHAASEASARHTQRLWWLPVDTPELLRTRPDVDSDADDRLLPVLCHPLGDTQAEQDSIRDVCPSCGKDDGIRWLGSSIATLLSVSLSTLFASARADDGTGTDAKALVFTDSVQDAAHRAGFVEARSHTLSLRTAIADSLTVDGCDLEHLAFRIIDAAGKDPVARFRLIPPDLVDRNHFKPWWSQPDLSDSRSKNRVRRRLAFDLALEFGLQSKFGRTLEATGAAVVGVSAPPTVMLTAARWVLNELGGGDVEGLTPATDAQLLAWVRGILERLRTQGAIHHEWLKAYIQADGNRWQIWGGRQRSQGMPAFPTGRSAPAFPRTGSPLQRASAMLLDPVNDRRSWFATWTHRVLQLPTPACGTAAALLLKRLAHHDILGATTSGSGATVHHLRPDTIEVRRNRDDGPPTQLRCRICHATHHSCPEGVAQLDGAPCMVAHCEGVMDAVVPGPNYYRTLYLRGPMRRIVARDHSSLIPDEERQEREQAFIHCGRSADDPNVLVATPTLEMGIDIGSLSTVMLASLPRTVASYVQRVGRSGRATGNALNLAFASGRGDSLPRLGEPLSLIDGEVRPPATYLSAEEMLRRQYLAHIVDGLARTCPDALPRFAKGALASCEPDSFLGGLIEHSETHHAALLDGFLGGFDGIADDTVAALRTWATPPDGPRTSPLAQTLIDASIVWDLEGEKLRDQKATLTAALGPLEAAHDRPSATDDDKRAFKTAQATSKFITARLQHRSRQYWVAALEEAGLLPNYSLIDEQVRLDVVVSWLDPERDEWDQVGLPISRPSARALTEFAPGAVFYSQSLQITVDAVDIGSDGDAVRPLVVCPRCGVGHGTEDGPVPAVCPGCGDPRFADAGQRLDTVELTRVFSEVKRDESHINDSNDDRIHVPFTVIGAAHITADVRGRTWSAAGTGFGVSFLPRVKLRWLNLGRTGVGPDIAIAGYQMKAPLFVTCRGCGMVETPAGQRHRPWCPHRDAAAPPTSAVALTRTATTQGVVLTLPTSVKGDMFAVPSLAAAVELGLRETYGGSPDHLGIMTIHDPVDGGSTRPSLLLYDTVPGGTGYLAELIEPARMWRLLQRARAVLESCECAAEDRIACHRCLLPFAYPDTEHVSRTSALHHLDDILRGGAGDAAEVVNSVDAPMRWRCEDKAVERPDPSSHLEARFREVFLDMVRTFSTTPHERPGRAGPSITFSIPHGHTWHLEPQPNVLGHRPDFQLICADGSLPTVLIETDGRAFHASGVHNRLADDARKRARFTDNGYLVVAITSADLDRRARSERPEPPWGAAVAGAFTQKFPGLTGQLDAALAGPFAWLDKWLTDPRPDDQAAMANALGFMVLGNPTSWDADAPLHSQARIVLRGGRPPVAVPARGGVWGEGACRVAGRLDGNVWNLAVLLDDRASAMAEPDHREAWEQWLRWSNLLQGRTQPTAIATSTMTDDDITVRGTATPALPPAWQRISTDLGGALDDKLAALVAGLAATDTPLPDVGTELTAELIPVDLAWPSHHVVVLVDANDQDRTDLACEGWRVVDATPEAVTAALKEPADG